jgi:hypothetical protein
MESMQQAAMGAAPAEGAAVKPEPSLIEGEKAPPAPAAG